MLSVGEAVAPHYQIIVDRINSLDTFEIQVEMSESFFTDEMSKLEQLKRKLDHDMTSMLGISAKITLMNPNTIARSEGKAIRIIDRRK